MPRNRRNLVVDADIVRAAGTAQATHPRSSLCRSVLEEISDSGHSIVLSAALSAEWRKHMSSYSSTWLTGMQSKSRVIRVSDADLPQLADMLADCKCTASRERRRAAMAKDMHLVEAALAPQAGKVVISGDGVIRSYLIAHVVCDPRIGVVVWVNPGFEEDRCLEWLRAGAKLERGRQLRRLGSAQT